MNKNNKSRFLEKANNYDENQIEETVVLSDIVHKDDPKLFDFYMVANKNPKAS